MLLFVSSLVSNHLTEEERAGCYLACICVLVSLRLGTMGRSVIVAFSACIHLVFTFFIILKLDYPMR